MNAKVKDSNVDLLFQAVLALQNIEECYSFFEDLCTVPELKAMSQRLVVAHMLSQKRVYSEIVSETGASTATISRVNRSLSYGNDGYRLVFDRLEADKKGMSGYSAFAACYDPLTLNIDYAYQADYYLSLFERYGSRPKLLLDLACGTGSLAIELLGRGVDVIGVDGSAQMLSIAREKAAQKNFSPLLLCQPMQKLDLYGTVNAAVCMLDSLNHLTRPQDVREVFRRMHLFVEPGGLFVFDVNTPYKHEAVLGNNTFVYDLDEVFCVWRCSGRESLVSIELDFFRREHGLYKRTSEHFCERAYPEDELRAWLSGAGFEVLDIFDDFTFRPVHEKSERAVYVTRRR